MNDTNSLYNCEKIQFSQEEKMSLYYNIRDILNSHSSKEEAAMTLVAAIEELFSSKLEELKENVENKIEGNFSNNKKSSFRRV